MARAILDEKNTANAASVFTFPLCISFNNISDAIIEIVTAVSVGRNFKKIPIAIPAKARWDNVSPIKDIRLDTTNIPNSGAVNEIIITDLAQMLLIILESIKKELK